MKKLLSILMVVMLVLLGCSSGQPETREEVAPVNQSVEEQGQIPDQEDEGVESVTKEESKEMEEEESVDQEPLPEFNKEALATYDGKDGERAYVAYEGFVYDVTEISAWSNGTHQGQFEAGRDYTSILNNKAPHSSAYLTNKAPVVGVYVGD